MTREQILQIARRGEPLRTSELASELGVSRQTVSGHLRRLVEEGMLEKSGSTKNATYLAVDSGGDRDQTLAAVGVAMPQGRRKAPDGLLARARWVLTRSVMTQAGMAVLALGVVVGATEIVQRLEGRDRASAGRGSREISSSTVSRGLGTQTIAAHRNLSIGAVTVEGGSAVTLHAGEMVTLGDGFTVDRGAALTVEIANADAEDPQDRLLE